MGYIRGEDRNQMILFPESIDDYISEDSVVRVIEAYVDQLDMEKLGFNRATSPTIGRPPYNPKDLLKLYLYGYLNRIRSSRRLEQEASRNLEVIWLLKKLKPDFKTVADFRKDNKKALKAVFRDFNKLCDEWDLFGKELVAIDGSKFRACNSKRNNYSKKKLDRHIKYIDEKIDKYMRELDENDGGEASDRKPNAQEIQKRLQQLRDRKEKYEGYKDRLEKTAENEISTTDPDARLMSNNNNSVDVSYNVQTSVDAKNKMIVDFKVIQKPNDLGQLASMALRTRRLFGGKKFEVVADKGYYKAEDLKKCIKEEITPYVSKQVHSNSTGDPEFYKENFKYDKDKNVYICPAGKELHYLREVTDKEKTTGAKRRTTGYMYANQAVCRDCKFKTRCTKNKKGRTITRHIDQDFLDDIDAKTELNMSKYRLRQAIVEHPFGTIKRIWGAYYFLTKRKVSVTAEVALCFLAYNLRRAINVLGTEEILKRLRERSGQRMPTEAVLT